MALVVLALALLAVLLVLALARWLLADLQVQRVVARDDTPESTAPQRR
jgi:hypothetical protein